MKAQKAAYWLLFLYLLEATQLEYRRVKLANKSKFSLVGGLELTHIFMTSTLEDLYECAKFCDAARSCAAFRYNYCNKTCLLADSYRRISKDLRSTALDQFLYIKLTGAFTLDMPKAHEGPVAMKTFDDFVEKDLSRWIKSDENEYSDILTTDRGVEEMNGSAPTASSHQPKVDVVDSDEGGTNGNEGPAQSTLSSTRSSDDSRLSTGSDEHMNSPSSSPSSSSILDTPSLMTTSDTNGVGETDESTTGRDVSSPSTYFGTDEKSTFVTPSDGNFMVDTTISSSSVGQEFSLTPTEATSERSTRGEEETTQVSSTTTKGIPVVWKNAKLQSVPYSTYLYSEAETNDLKMSNLVTDGIKWYLHKIDVKNVLLKSYYQENRFLAANLQGHVIISPSPYQWEVSSTGNIWTLKSAQGMWLSADSNGRLKTAKNVGNEERFRATAW